MSKRITAKIEEYQKDGETKGKYVEIGVILSNEKGEYALIHPHVDLAGVLMKQRILASETGKKSGNSVMCSIFDNDRQQSRQPNNGDFGPPPSDDFDQEIPF